MKRRILAFFCVLATLLGMVVLPAYAAEESAVTVLSQDMEDLLIQEDTYIDLNGYSITGVTVEDGTLYVSDSKTDDYTVADGVYGTVTGINGNVQAAEGYVAITEGEAVSYHKVDLTLTSMTLRPAVAGVYYNSAFAADEVVAENVECYGVALSVVEAPTAENLDTLCGYSTIYGFASGEKSGTLLTGIMTEDNTDYTNDRNAAMAIYGRAYIKTADGYTFGATASRDLKTQVEAIDAIFANLTDAQKASILSMYASFESVMAGWNVPNMKHAAGTQGDTVITVPVEIVDGMVAESVTVEQDGVTITVPFGTLVDGEELTLTVTRKTESDSGIEAEEGQTLMPFDVHVDGIAAENTQPVTVALGKVMPENLNMGNYTVYHVEESGTNEMTLVENGEEFDAHNQYKYDLDGNLTLYMASFSEVAALSENENSWQGKRDYSWYDADATELEIRNADQLAGFGAIVGGMAKTADPEEAADIEQDSFSGKTVKLLADISIGDTVSDNGIVFYPIGYWNNEGTYERLPVEERETAVSSGFYAFEGIFDGNGNTISNIYQNTWEMKGDHNWYDPIKEQYFRDGMGLFGKVYGGTVKNLTVDNFKSDGEITTTGVIAAYADSGNGKSATFENISITNCNPRVYNIGNGGIVGCAGWYSRSDETATGKPVIFNNITVDQSNKISALWGTYDVSCGGILGQYYPDSQCGLKFNNCHVAAIIDVNNDVCANYQYYWYRYSGMLMGTVRANTKDADGYTVADTTGIEVTGCTYTYGSWNEYWYCELVKNSSASYTHDYQFGRLDNIAALSEIQDAQGNWTKEGNFALVSDDRKSVECYHIFKNSEGNLYRHEHDSADESNNYSPYETFDLDGNGKLDDLKEDRQRYYLPFGQVLNGLGYGVKPTYEFDGFDLVEDGTVISGPKFAVKDGADLSYEPGETVYLKNLVDLIVDESKLSQSSLYAAASPVNEEDTVSVTYSRDVEEWENNYITFSEDTQGAVKLVITDYFYCEPTVIYLNVGVAEPVEKFQATAITNVDAEKIVTLGELFTALPDATINNANVSIDVTGGTFKFAKNEADWTQSTVTFTETATYTVVITDADNCIPAERTVTVDAIDKFDYVFENTDKYLYRVGNADGSTVALNLLFEALDDVTVSSADIEFTPVAGNASGTYTRNATWNNGTIQFSGTGVVKVTITAANAKPLTLNLEVVEAKNVTTATSATANNVVLLKDCGLSSLTVSGRYTFYGNGFTATYTGNGQYLNNGLKMGIVTVSGNGTLDNLRIKAPIYPAAYLYYTEEVKNGPSSTETASDGTTKTRYHYQLSTVRAQDNATISNCYIFGGRNNVYVDIGDVTLKNTILENGTFANMQIISTSDYTITLDNVTTIQYMTHPTIGDTTINTMGAGIVVGDGDKEKLDTATNPKIVLNGDFKQYNWVNGDDHEALPQGNAKTIVGTAFGDTQFWHTVNGKNASNFGIAYLNENAYEVENNTGLPYVGATVSIMTGVNGQVYTLKNGTADQIYWDHANADRSTVNGLYVPQFTYSADLGGQYEAKSDTSDTYCYREGDIIRVMFPSDSTKELDLAALVSIVKYAGQDLGLVVTCKDSSGNTVNLTDKITLDSIETYTVTFAVTDSEIYDHNAEKMASSVDYSWDVSLDVSLKDVSIPNARFDFVADNQKMGYYAPAFGDVKQYLPFLAGLKIYDYNGQTEYLRFDGDADYNKLASITITQYVSNEAYIEVKLTDGGVINTKFLARADSGGGSTYTGSIKTRGNVVYFVNGGGTSNKDTTTTAAFWYVDYYKFTGNNGVAIQSAQQTFNSPGSSASTPSGSFSTTITYTVTYDPNEGTCGQAVGYATSVAGSVTLPTPTRSGYLMAGWYDAPSGGNKVGNAGASYTPTANITLYAQWGKPCTVTYNANGGSVSPATAKYTGTALTLPTPTRDGYWFTGWYDAATGGSKIGDAGSPYNPSGEITLYAHWQEMIEYTVTYNANGGTCGTASATYQGTALTLPTPTREGYTFNGWYDATSGGNKATSPYTPAANITLYAQWQINSYTINVTANNATVKVNGTAVSNNGTVSIQYGTQVTVEVTYSETESQSTTIKGADNTTYTSPFNMPAQNVTINATSTAPSSGNCITGDTLITLADGRQVPVEDLTGEEMLLVWNLETGRYEAAPIVFVDSDAKTECEVIRLVFSDGTDVEIIYEHGFFDVTTGEYVYLDAYNAENYIGHSFIKQGDIAQNTWDTVELVDVIIERKVTTAYSPVTFSHLCYYVDGMLSMPGGIEGLFNIFEVDTDTMSYNAEKMAADIETYGLFTYEDFAALIPEEAFYAFNGAWLKVAMGKGMLTWEDIEYMANRYVPLM